VKVASKANTKKAAMREHADDIGVGQFLRCEVKSVGCMI
jgi:hypothetical protein